MEPGHVFWRAGEPGTYSLMVDYGRVRCVAADGRATTVGSRYVLGSMDPLCNKPRSYDAIAETAVIGLRVDRDDWMMVIENHRRMGTNLLRVLAMQLLHLQLEDARRRQASAAA